MVSVVISSSLQILVALLLETAVFAFPVAIVGNEDPFVYPIPDFLDFFDCPPFFDFRAGSVELFKFGGLRFDQAINLQENLPVPVPIRFDGELVNGQLEVFVHLVRGI